ncbi:MAG: spore coat associated protein CotJA [Lachnospiraceae bacterium]|nr:spore coat associated protein CotJA [Lachnospiraceae bacterium]
MRHFMPGMAYVPMQEWGDLYDLEDAHCQGTIFPELNYIFCGARGKM